MTRGEIWWACLPAPRGSGPGKRRPVIVIQSDAFNRSRIPTVVVAVITSDVRLGTAPGNVSLSTRQSGLAKDSVINVSQVLTIDKNYLTENVGQLTPAKLVELEEGLRLVLQL